MGSYPLILPVYILSFSGAVLGWLIGFSLVLSLEGGDEMLFESLSLADSGWLSSTTVLVWMEWLSRFAETLLPDFWLVTALLTLTSWGWELLLIRAELLIKAFLSDNNFLYALINTSL